MSARQKLQLQGMYSELLIGDSWLPRTLAGRDGTFIMQDWKGRNVWMIQIFPETSEQELSQLEETHKKLGLLSLTEIGIETGCHRPCLYRTYHQFGEITEMNFSHQDQTTLSLILSSSEVTRRRENFVYPLISFISEVGGALGLFLGFSFLSLWDLIQFLFSLAYKHSLGPKSENL